MLIPPSLIKELSDQLDRGLRAILFFSRHVQVIHKQNAPASLGAVESFTFPVHFSVNNILSLDGGGLCREPEFNR